MRWPHAVAVVLVFAACTGAPAVWTGRVVAVDGVVRVENPVAPLAEPGEVTTRPLWSVGGPERGAVWEVPNRVHVREGTVFVVDRGASRVHRVTTDGVALPSLGEPGSGPGQYRRIVDALPTPAGLFVVDIGNARIELLSDSGEARNVGPLDRVVYGAVPLGANAIALYGVSAEGTGWTRVDAGGVQGSIEFPDFPAPPTSSAPVSSATTWNGRPVRLRYTTPEIRIYSEDGVLEREFAIPLPVVRASDDEIERVVRDATTSLLRDGLPSAAIEQAAASIREWPREKLRFRKIDFDDATGLAAIWEQNPEDYGSGPATLHLLTSDGVYLASLPFDRTWSDFDVDRGMLYCLSRDPHTDLVSLRAYALDVPPRLFEQARAILESPPAGRPEGP